jgi:hypothetical protein
LSSIETSENGGRAKNFEGAAHWKQLVSAMPSGDAGSDIDDTDTKPATAAFFDPRKDLGETAK